MLQDNFFTISTLQNEGNNIAATLSINPSHHIFEGHFPDFPVVPGVCMMQMMREIMEGVLDKKTRIVKADHLKFLAVINPQENAVVDTVLTYKTLENGNIGIEAKLFKEATIFFKMKCVLSVL